MHRLRHPIRSITEPYGKAGLMVAILALALATTGAAFAAAGLNSKQKKEVTKIAKKYAGKPGANGTNGTNGTNGAPGEKGPKGDPGTNGENGKSVKVVGNASPSECEAGGKLYEVEGSGSKNKICNGKNGAIQPGETLPKGATETGTYAILSQTTGATWAPISFTIPLAAALGEEHLLYVPYSVQTGKTGSEPGEFCEGKSGTGLTECEAEASHIAAECPGSLESPEAVEGNLCVYEAEVGSINASLITFGQSTKAGLFVAFSVSASPGVIHGTWAVTAP